MKSMLSKLPFALVIILVANILPVAGHLSLLADFRMWIIILTTALIIFSQPAFKQEDSREHRQSDKRSVLVILVMSVISLATPVIHWAYFQENRGITAFTWLGICMIVAGFALRIYAIRYLGRFFTATVQAVEGHRLITGGPYRLVRHPSYLGAYLIFTGGAVMFQSLPGLIVAIVAIFFAYYKRITAEEALLLQLFGEEYEQYRRKTFRLVPYIW